MAEWLSELEARIGERTATLAVIGLGYVGIPVAASFADAGFQVLGIDRDEARVEALRRGKNPLVGEEPGLEERIARAVGAGKLEASLEPRRLAEADVVLVCVETPVDPVDHRPQYGSLESAIRSVGEHGRDGILLVVESTLAPGTMDGPVRRWLAEAGKRVGLDVALGHCPERVMPGKLLNNLRSMSRVCGGDRPETSRSMRTLYRSIVDAELDASSLVVAELSKTAENAYRDVSIAFANELARICERVGADFLEVRALVNKSPGRNVLFAGLGVGGHCIPKDPWLLAAAMDEPGALSLIPAARSSNDAMPRHVCWLVEDALAELGRTLQGARVAILGQAYLEETADERNSPSEALAAELAAAGAEPRVHDPFIARFAAPLEDVVTGADAIVVAVGHRAYRSVEWASLRPRLRSPVLVDARFVVTPVEARAAGFVFRGVGRGESRRPPASAQSAAHRR